MKAELVVPGEKRAVQEAVSRFLKERKDLYREVAGPGRFTGYSFVEAKVSAQHARLAATRGCFSIIVGLFDPIFMQDAAGDPSIKVTAKPANDGGTRLKIVTTDGVKPEAIEPFLAWLRENLGAIEG